MPEYPEGIDWKHPNIHKDTEFNRFFSGFLKFPHLSNLRLRRDIYPYQSGVARTTPLILVAETPDIRAIKALQAYDGKGWYEAVPISNWRRFQQGFFAPRGTDPAWMNETIFGELLKEKGFVFDSGFYVHPQFPPNGFSLPLQPLKM